jgi:hypothetical protein
VVLAIPEEFVVAVGAENVPPTPPSEKLTWIPSSGLPARSLTLTFSGRGNWVVTGVSCLFPEEIDSVAGPVEVAVSTKVALAYPRLDAVIV